MARTSAVKWAACGVIAAALCAARASAQQQRIPTYGELRAEGIFASHRTTVLGGGGIVVPAGNYTRISVDGSLGAEVHTSATQLAGRADIVARFLLDPLREMPWAVSLGGGLSVPYARDMQGVHPLLTAVVDVEGRRRGRLTPALQVGLGGGARVALVFRASPRAWR
jgi:hypothetical protein